MTCKASLCAAVFVCLISGCGSSDKQPAVESNPPEAESPESMPSPQLPIDSQPYDVSVLMVGNSHTLRNDLPVLLERLLQAHAPDAAVIVRAAPESQFLYEHVRSSATMNLLTQNSWSHTVLQAQRYSQSRSTVYPTDAAIELIKTTKTQGGIPVLFPEWGQLGRGWESQYVYDLHRDIADQEAACLAPIGFAWDMTLRIEPQTVLHAVDGNHATLAGSFLTALVLFETITGYAADALPPLQGIGIPDTTQSLLRQMASQAVADHPPCSRLE